MTTYSFSIVSDPNAGSEGTVVTGVNGSGEVAGDYYDSGGTEHGFTYSNGSFTDFSHLPGAPPLAFTHIGIVAGINDSGEVAGYYYNITPLLGAYGFVDNNGSYSYFSISTGQTGGFVTAINAAGEVIGNYYGTFAAGAFQPPTGFIYVSGTITDIDDPGANAGGNPFNSKIGTFVVAINASGEVAGYYKDSNGVPHGFTYSGATFTNFSDPDAGSMGTLVAGINGFGATAGDYYDSGGTEHGFTYINGTFSNFSDPDAGSMGTNVAGINDSGEVAGNYYDSSGTEHGFTYINGTFSNFSDPNAGSGGTTVTGINDAGQVVGDYYDSTGVEHGFVADPLATLATLVSFNGANGALPNAGLIADAAGDLFGTTETLGANGDGTVYEIAKAGTGYATAPTTLASLNGTNGESPLGSLIADTAGDLFGTASRGGAYGDGTVFEIAKTGGGYASTPTTLVSFNGADGAFPYAGLIADAAGNLFGTTAGGTYTGGYSYGTVFEIANTGGSYAGTPTTLADLNGIDGPSANLIADTAGDLFGTTAIGGANDEGTVFEIAKTGSGYASTPAILASFNGTNGNLPIAGLITDAAGDLFGTTENGGADGDGTVFEIPYIGGSYASTPTVLASFDLTDGAYPDAGLIADAAGDLFGTTEGGGANSDGTVFEIVKTGGSYASTPTTLESFNGANGIGPESGLIADAAGDLLGTTTGVSPVTGAQVADGTAFELSGAGFQVPVAFAIDDVTTGVQSVQSLSQATPYSGPVYGLVDQYIYTSADDLNVAAGVANTFIHTGSGEDAIDVSHVGGINVLDGGTNSNFLVGATGPFSFDTFFVDDRSPSSDIWSTVANFHAGDAATIFGITQTGFNTAWVDGEGAAGYTGLTLHVTAPGVPTASLTLSGYTTADLTNGKLTTSYGTENDGTPYLYVHANS